MTPDPVAPPATVHWIVDLTVDAVVVPPAVPIGMLPCDGPVGRQAFYEWIWTRYGDDGLVGIDEGSIDIHEAARLGFVETPLVIDTAAAPAERDWINALTAATAACWFTNEAAARAAAHDLAAARGCRVVGIRHAIAADDGDEWRRAVVPIEVPGFGTIRPAWEEGAAATVATAAGDRATTLFIDPGTGFGTGGHETTQLCLEALARWRRAGGGLEHVLDFGAGSGILGIAAALLGAGGVDAVEIDGRVHDAIRSNARRNDVGDRVLVATHLPAADRSYDLVLANIVAAVLIDHADPLCRAIRRPGAAPGGLILSGIRADDLPAVAAEFTARLGVTAIHAEHGGWYCLLFGAHHDTTASR